MHTVMNLNPLEIIMMGLDYTYIMIIWSPKASHLRQAAAVKPSLEVEL